MKKSIIVGIIIVAIIGGAVWYSKVFETKVQAPQISRNPVPPTTGSTTGFAKLGPNAIYVAEQRPGKEILVNIVNMAEPGYVVIHESVDGKPGAIIGTSALLEATASNNVLVTLTRVAKDGEELVAMLHAEKGGAGFDAATDLPVLDTQGNVLHMIFQVSANAADPGESQVMF